MAERFGGTISGLNIVVEDAPGGYHQGYDVSLNGVLLWRRPYDGCGPAVAAREVAEALCEMLRAHTGRTLPEGGEDDA